MLLNTQQSVLPTKLTQALNLSKEKRFHGNQKTRLLTQKIIINIHTIKVDFKNTPSTSGFQ